ncbi:MAG: adenylate/guanylate cyclase domain-containing protein, partial [Campylobacterota bacterium]|nr:adenylate/guanylate cyclase domain-containing protein [Campylobacterota bacterium]
HRHVRTRHSGITMLRRLSTLAGVLFILIVSLGWLYLATPQKFLSLDDRFRDFLFLMRGSVPTTGEVVIVDIDEQSLHQYGQWPWSRNVVASLITQLRDNGAGIIGLDIVFAEADKSIQPFKREEQESCPNPHDKALASAIKESPVIGGYFFSFDFNTSKAPSIPAIFVEKGLSEGRYIPEPIGARLNIDCLQDSFYSSGFFNTTPDPGGMVRHIPLLMRYHDILYPSLALEMIRIYTNTNKVIVQNSETGVDSIKLNDLLIHTDRYARMNINFRGASRHFHYISASDIIEKRVDPSEVRGKFVLVGTSAVGLSDLKPTPFDTVMPGVEVHANMIDSILADDLITTPHNIELIDLAMIIVIVIFSALIFYLLNGWLIIPALILCLYGLYQLFFMLLFDNGTIINILIPLISLFATMLVTLLLRYLFTSQRNQQLKRAFAQKVSPAVMNDILTNETQNLLEPKEKNVTIFFSDIRSFTTISETIGEPEDVILLLNEYLTPMVDIIVDYHGTIDKFIGDAVMAYWNAPTDVANHADQALQSAIEQLRRLKEINRQIEEYQKEQYLKIKKAINENMADHNSDYDMMINIGIGINTGLVTIGEMGSSGRSDYTIIGDNVNLASRLEGLCKTYGVPLIISETTKDALVESYPIRKLDLVRVKGKSRPVTIYEVLIESISQEELQRYDNALDLYNEANFEDAREQFEILVNHSDRYSYRLYKMYKRRCDHLIKEKTSDFDGVFNFTTK